MRTAFFLALISTVASAQVPDVAGFAAISRDSAVRLRWTNPKNQTGVLILRATAPIRNVPVDGVTYAQGATIGNATVAYVTSSSVIDTFDDTALVNATSYYYRIFKVGSPAVYSSGNVPSSNGLTSAPTPATGAAARWCYAMGASAVMQPVVETGVGVFFAGNNGTVNSSSTNPGRSSDGDERWRPVVLAGSVQGRFPLLTLYGASTRTILTGDSSGHAYALNASTGALQWTAASALGDAIMAQPAVQLRAYANAAFVAANPSRDLVFFATRNASATNNAVYALDGNTGAQVWSYTPGDLDIVNGGMLVDYATNRLFVAARSNGGSQQSLRVLDSLTGARLEGFSLGDIDTGVIRNPTSNQAVVVSGAGTVTGISLADLTIGFQVAVGAPTSWAFPVNSGFILSLSSGAVERWSVTGSTATRMWTTPIANPSGVNLEYVAQVAYVGSTDGKLHQLSLATGADQLQIDLGDDGVGTPSIDMTAMRIHVGTLGGHVCALPLP